MISRKFVLLSSFTLSPPIAAFVRSEFTVWYFALFTIKSTTMSFFKNIKSAFRKIISSTPVKLLKVSAVVVVGLFALTGIMHAMTFAVSAFKGLASAFSA